MAAGKTWRCSQCGAVNEAGSRACSNCGKWPSLFDLQAPVEDAPEPAPGAFEVEDFEPEAFEPQTFETETFESETFESAPQAEDETEKPKSRFPRWAVTAIWVLGLLIWLVANALGDSC